MEKSKLTSQQHKEIGKKLFLNNHYIEAIIAYRKSQELQTQSQKKAILLMNIGLCFHHLNVLESYFDSVQDSLRQNPKYEKALYHKIKSLILLNKIQAAQNLLKENGWIEQKDKKYLEGLINTINIANKKGYEFSQNWQTALQQKNLQFSHISDDIQVRKGKYGLGLFAKKNISSQRIIIVEKPLVFLSKKEQFQTGSDDERSMCNKIKKLINISPQFQRKFKRISTKKTENLSLQQRQKQKSLSNEQIMQAIKLNWFEATQFVQSMCENKQNFSSGSGIYTSISLINHRCERHCQFFFIGQWMLVRSIRPIKKDEQIYINYYYELEQLSRRKKLKSVWDIKCDCVFCIEQRKMDNGLIKPGQSNFQSQELKLHLISSQMFFRGLDQQFKFTILNNPQTRWKNVLNHHNQTQLKAKMIASIFKSPSLQGYLLKTFGKQSNKINKNEHFDLISSFKDMMK